MISMEKNIPKVLVVDDEPDITEVLKMGLELKGGFQVDSFNNPQDALLHFRPGFYDLLLSDIKMPDLNGFELYSKIRDVDKRIRVLESVLLLHFTFTMMNLGSYFLN